MTDLHTHILPGMDDGARNCEESAAMLRMEKAQRVDTVALTPHFYPDMEKISSFLSRRSEAYGLLKRYVQQLPPQEQAMLPELILGTEVAWIRGIGDLPELESLCYENSPYLLVELPFSIWDNRVFDDINDIMNRRGLIPVIAHIDRYLPMQSEKQLQKLFQFGLPIQISSAAFDVFRLKRKVGKLLETGIAQLVISDCHNTVTRPPDLDRAYARIQKKYSVDYARTISRCSDKQLQRRW